MSLKEIIQKIKDYFKEYQYQFYESHVTGSEIRTLLEYKFDLKYCEILDGNYMTTNLKKLQGAVDMIPVKMQPYLKEVHDCDNFAFEFMGLAKKVYPMLPIGYCHVQTKTGLLPIM